MKRKLIYSLALVLCILSAQSQIIVFQKIFGSIWSDKGYGVTQATDSGYVFTGIIPTGNPSYDNIVLMKTNKYGNTVWTKYLKTTTDQAGAYALTPTNNNGYAVAGHQIVQGAESYLVNTNSLGDTLWTGHYNLANYYQAAYSVKQTQDNGFVLSGYIGSPTNYVDAYILKTTASGTLQWSKNLSFSPGRGAIAHSALEINGGYVVAGHVIETPSSSNSDVFLTKLNSLGDTVWQKIFPGSSDDQMFSMLQTPDEGFIISGATMSYGSGAYDAFLMKVDSNGVKQWLNTYGWIDNEYGNYVAPTTDGGYIIAGSTQSFGAGNYDAYIVKTDSLGSEQWYRTFGGSYDDYAYCIQQTFDGGYIFVGMRGDNIQLVKLDGNGFTTDITELEASGLSAIIAPNPFTTQTTISVNHSLQNATVILYNTLGQEVQHITNLSGRSININRNQLPAGIYTLHVINAQETLITKKMIITD